jgi:hypothetical protein
VAYRRSLGVPAAQAVIQAPLDFAPDATGRDAEPAQSAAATLIAAASTTDDRLLPARIFAVRTLGVMPGVEATQGLLDVASRTNYPPQLRAAAGEAVSHRTDGAEALVAALDQHYDYLRQTTAPPVGYIARALVSARERSGNAGLVRHLQDPETPAQDLPAIASALRDLGDSTVVPALLDFLRLYHADDGPVPPVSGGEAMNDRSIPDQLALNDALDAVVQAIVRLGGTRDRRWIRYLRRDGNTLEPIRAAMDNALSGSPQGTPEEDRSAGSTDGEQTSPGSSSSSDETGQAIPPPRVTPEMIQDAFAPVRDRMLRCLAGAASRPGQLRIQFRYDSAGALSSVTVTPREWSGCIAPIAGAVRLPASQVSREIGTYYLIGETP